LSSPDYDAIVLGAGGAGLMCALHAGRRGKRVLVLDHADKIGGKILISGGGRCNFTNTVVKPLNYVSENEHFCKSALSRYTPEDFIEMVRAHEIPFHEKKLGQLFCDRSARDIVEMLRKECAQAGVEIRLRTKIERVLKTETGFEVHTSESIGVGGAGSAPSVANTSSSLTPPASSSTPLSARAVVVATGGFSIPRIGATGIGYKLARQFDLKVTETRPALDGFTFSDADMSFYRDLAGLSVDCVLSCKRISFRENILFTHVGLSGPAALQVSLHWNPGDAIEIDLLPDRDPAEHFQRRRQEGSRSLLRTLLAELLPSRLADQLCRMRFPQDPTLAQTPEKALAVFCQDLRHWKIVPSGTVGYSKAEVTRGGVDTHELSSKTMEAKKVPGLYFIGEVVDVTGWLGGFNFQWAWASGWAAAQSL